LLEAPEAGAGFAVALAVSTGAAEGAAVGTGDGLGLKLGLGLGLRLGLGRSEGETAGVGDAAVGRVESGRTEAIGDGALSLEPAQPARMMEQAVITGMVRNSQDRYKPYPLLNYGMNTLFDTVHPNSC
jgi:hypothetical protein